MWDLRRLAKVALVVQEAAPELSVPAINKEGRERLAAGRQPFRSPRVVRFKPQAKGSSPKVRAAPVVRAVR
ncbi:hypothetical protein Aam_011_004 [Acidocella aminolytica 101 = DSM 11237]|uniref:Uncharacterized protein n=1 Tax=Acidocella aminolytica 101 = DSM 11237 TaxID=1120923 RepID=A0A0D6PCF3_9PROT|nr:hypothetical protein Aam_011_004 [Acidocella aminolytica 101 = DSM 11237]GBQ42328.1 hypothetical protein AA11237_2943 [Acidocella aminolytica 101 = DSM 11237]